MVPPRGKGRRPVRAGERRRLVVPPSPSGRGVRRSVTGTRRRWPAAYARFGDEGPLRRRRPWSWPSPKRSGTTRPVRSGKLTDGRCAPGRSVAVDAGRPTCGGCCAGRSTCGPSTRAAETPHVLWRAVCELSADDGAYAEETKPSKRVVDDRRRRTAASGQRAARPPNAAAGDGSGGVIPYRTCAWRSAGVGRRVVVAVRAGPGELAHAGNWHSDREAAAAADQALAVARTTGKPLALSYRRDDVGDSGHGPGSVRGRSPPGDRGVDMAAAAGDGWAFVHAVMWEANASPEPFGEETADLFRRRREQLAALRGADTYLARSLRWRPSTASISGR